MEKFLEIYSLPTMSHEEMENLTRPIYNEEIETTIKTLPPPQKKYVQEIALLVNSTNHSKI